MSSELIAPLTPPDCDLRDFAFMPLDVVRLRDSDLAAMESPEACWAAVLLWCASWHQMPAASLPDDDRVLANLAGFGRVVKEWQRVRSGALRGWMLCSDGRLYHPVIAEKANDAWNEKHAYRERKAKRIAAAKVAAESKWEKYRGEEEIQTNSELRSQRIKDARKKGVHTEEQWVAILNACGNKCVKCGSSESIVKDHICPIYKGGSDGIDNIQPLCRSCNSSKGADETDNRPSAVIRLSQALNREYIDLMAANRRHSAVDTTCRKGEGQEQGEVKGQKQGEGVNKKQPAAAVLASLGVEKDVAADWIQLRKTKKATITKTALDGMQREADKAGISLTDAMRICCEKGWAAFDSSWDWKSKGVVIAGGSRADQIARNNEQVAAEFLAGSEKVIEGEFVNA